MPPSSLASTAHQSRNFPTLDLIPIAYSFVEPLFRVAQQGPFKIKSVFCSSFICSHHLLLLLLLFLC